MSECVADEIVDSVVKVAVVVAEGGVVDVLHVLPEDIAPPAVCTVVNVPLMDTGDDEDVASPDPVVEVTETGTAVAGLAGGSIEKISLLFSGSKADCDERLSTELQLMERVESSSAKPESVSLIKVVVADESVVLVALGVDCTGDADSEVSDNAADDVAAADEVTEAGGGVDITG